MRDPISTCSRLRHHGLASRRSLLGLALLGLVLLGAQWLTGAGALFALTPLQCPFDERWAGYSVEQARSTLAALQALPGEQQQAYTAYRLLDLIFPWVLGAWLVGLLRRLGAARLAGLGWWAAGVDTLENLVLWLLWLDPASLVQAQIGWASGLTQLKWVVYGLTAGTLVVLLVRHWQRPATEATGEFR